MVKFGVVSLKFAQFMLQKPPFAMSIVENKMLTDRQINGSGKYELSMAFNCVIVKKKPLLQTLFLISVYHAISQYCTSFSRLNALGERPNYLFIWVIYHAKLFESVIQ